MSSQKPCGEILATSTAEVLVPSGTDFISVVLDQGRYGPDLTVIQAMILRQRNLWLKPEFGFPVRALHMYMPTRLLAGEEVKPIMPSAKNCGAHALSLRDGNYPKSRKASFRKTFSL